MDTGHQTQEPMIMLMLVMVMVMVMVTMMVMMIVYRTYSAFLQTSLSIWTSDSESLSSLKPYLE